MIDKKLSDILSHEQQRQVEGLEMIASENYVSKDVLQAYANIFTNKYSEGNPGARYYGGNEFVDDLERETQYRALQMFGLVHHPEHNAESHDTQLMLHNSDRGVNVQPHSGSPANLAVYMGVLKPGDTVLAMDLNAGGHLSHGHRLNASAIYYNFISYGLVRETLDIDYEDIRSKALEHKPAMIIAGFSAYPKTIDWKRFATIADEVSKVHGYRPLLMADIAHIAGLIAGEVLSSPFPYFDIITTTTHKTLRGPRGALIYMRKNDHDLEKKINRGVFPGLQGGPHEHVIYAKAVAFNEVLQPSFKDYAKKVIENAKVLASELIALGWPVLTGTTENHIVLVDVTYRLNGNNHEKNNPSHAGQNERTTKGQTLITPEYEQTFKNYCENYENYIEAIKQYEESYVALQEWITGSLEVLPELATIFEIGSGTGRDATYIETLGYTVQRSEIIPGFIKLLQQGGNSVIEYNPIHSPLTGKYHAVVSRGGFAHHNYNQLSHSLRNIASGLHNDGILVFDVKYGEGEGMMVSGGKSFERFFKHWSQEELQNVLQENGYEVVQIVISDDKKRIKAIAKNIQHNTRTGLTGKIAEEVLEKIGISVNKNLLPFDTRSPMDPSGLRLGTPAITTRGLGTAEIKIIASIISRALENYSDEGVLEVLKNEVKELCKKFPLEY